MVWADILDDDPYFLDEDGEPIETKVANLQDQSRRLIGFKAFIMTKRIEDIAVTGLKFLKNLRLLEKDYGVEGSFSHSGQFLDIEQWYTFRADTSICFVLSGSALLGVILVFTSDLIVTGVVFLCVLFTNTCLFGLVYFWALSLNPLVVLNIVIAIGISVDYSAHIGYAFLTTPVPENKGIDTPKKIRYYKARVSLSTMGASVFHGGFSTFLAILVLAPGGTYIFVVFFRIWMGIIIFGMTNGFLLLPVLLSFIGPTETVSNPAAASIKIETHTSSSQEIELTEDRKPFPKKKIVSDINE